ncbi:SDR family NAD(P)-dependent oxidoreductase [Streptomyces sp. NPDC058459]|uniref:SDR family NAD(P)-dependent oxidoreductase n=1 Tax=Streptomyces sp. NPDC058459 TaxID=3346508 RepID=UPI00364F4EC7
MTQAKVALVTGANRGIGLAVARQLGERGHTVFVGSRDVERGAKAAAELSAAGGDAHAVRLDVTDVAGVRAAAERIGRDHGRLDCLVNNAAVFVGAPLTSVTVEQLRELFEANVFGAVTVVNALLPLLRSAPQPRIVNVSSTTGSLTLTAQQADLPGDATVRAAYTSSKAALNMLTVQYDRVFRADPELAHMKINSATPGYTATAMNDFRGTNTPEQAAAVIVRLATLPPDGPSGTFVGAEDTVPW